MVARRLLSRLILRIPDRVLIVENLTLIVAQLWHGLALLDADFGRRFLLDTSLHVVVCFVVILVIQSEV